ncbi:MAG: Rpn family recombination-promoting nuclease/putative transposase [Selenomonadaceae bacterium]|nr:Rpn family recombination-promoting nuclease/putative transposase [Selenomonadaceae bacterium]
MAYIKTWEELTISDNFLFQKVMQNESVCKRFIEKLLRISVKSISYPIAEKVIETSPTQKGIRLDLYVETAEGTVLDIEMQTTEGNRAWLPKRTRYYQATIDVSVLKKGTDYTMLKKTYIIFICTFDPFGYNRKIYTFTNRCREQRNLELGDEAVRIFLNSKGTVGRVDKDIDKFLAYVESGVAEGQFTQDIAAEIKRLKTSKETEVEYMTWTAEMQDQRREGRLEGMREGLIEGRREGMRDGLDFAIRNMIETLGFTVKQAMDALKIPIAEQPQYAARLQNA